MVDILILVFVFMFLGYAIFIKPMDDKKDISGTYIPYQLCPKCNGTGMAQNSAISALHIGCDVCNGKKIIPMHETQPK